MDSDGPSRPHRFVLRAITLTFACAGAAPAQVGDRPAPKAKPDAPLPSGIDAVVARTVRVQVTRIVKNDKSDKSEKGEKGKSSASEVVRDQIVGFLLDDGKRVATFGELLEDGATIVVETGTGDLRRGKSASRDPQSGIGVVCVDPLPVVPCEELDASKCTLGTSLYVVGDPQHLGLATTQGSLAARSRLVTEDEADKKPMRRPPLLQLSIVCDPGDRGGPVATADGAVVGLCLGPYAPADAKTRPGLAFAVPIAEVESVCKLLDEVDRDHQSGAWGRSPRPYLGVWAMDIYDPVLEAQLELDEDQGILIENVFPDSPAARAGVTRFDVVSKIDGKILKGTLGLRDILLGCRVDQTIVLEVIRKGKRIEVKVKL